MAHEKTPEFALPEDNKQPERTKKSESSEALERSVKETKGMLLGLQEEIQGGLDTQEVVEAQTSEELAELKNEVEHPDVARARESVHLALSKSPTWTKRSDDMATAEAFIRDLENSKELRDLGWGHSQFNM